MDKYRYFEATTGGQKGGKRREDPLGTGAGVLGSGQGHMHACSPCTLQSTLALVWGGGTPLCHPRQAGVVAVSISIVGSPRGTRGYLPTDSPSAFASNMAVNPDGQPRCGKRTHEGLCVYDLGCVSSLPPAEGEESAGGCRRDKGSPTREGPRVISRANTVDGLAGYPPGRTAKNGKKATLESGIGWKLAALGCWCRWWFHCRWLVHH